MTTPSVTKVPTGLEPVQPDPFIETLPRSPDPGTRRVERELRERRIERVRRLMRLRTERAARNERTASGTDRP
jgi:hypothetical protein